MIWMLIPALSDLMLIICMIIKSIKFRRKGCIADKLNCLNEQKVVKAIKELTTSLIVPALLGAYGKLEGIYLNLIIILLSIIIFWMDKKLID